jgi:excisionase family DNA binding protein
MKKPAKKTYSITEAARKLGITRQAVHKAIERGTLKAEKREIVKIEWEIPAEALRAYSLKKNS